MAATLLLADRSLFVLAVALRYIRANLDDVNEAMGCYGDDAATARLLRVTAPDGGTAALGLPVEGDEIDDILDTILPDVIGTSL